MTLRALDPCSTLPAIIEKLHTKEGTSESEAMARSCEYPASDDCRRRYRRTSHGLSPWRTVSWRAPHDSRKRKRCGAASDRAQQRRIALRVILPARLAEGSARGCGHPTDGRLLPGEWDSPRSVRQAGGGGRRQ